MEPTRLNDAISALLERRWDDYDEIMRDLLSGESDDQTWEIIAAAHPAKLNLIDALLSWPKERMRSAHYRLLPAIRRLSALDLADALRLLEYSASLEPSYRHIVAQNLGPHIAKRPDLGCEIGEHLRKGTTLDDASQRVWAGAFASFAQKEAADYATELVTGTDTDTRLLAQLISFLPIDSPPVRTALAGQEKEIANLLYLAVPLQGYEAWTALACFAEISSSAMAYLLAALDAHDAQAAMAMSNALYRITSASVGVTHEPLERILHRLVTIGLENEQIRPHIDRGIESLLFHKLLRSQTVSFLLDLGTVDGRIAELFQNTFEALGDRSGDFAFVLTAWLLRPDASFQAIGSLLSLCVAKKALVGLDAAAFVATSTERRVKAARRLLALTHNGPTLCQFIAFLAEMTALGPERLDLAAQMFNEAFAEYPGATEDFLREKSKICSRAATESAVYRGVYANVLRWRRVLARLPDLKELRPTDSDLHTLRTMKRRMNRDIIRGAAERSIFAEIFTSVHVAQGRKFASHTQFAPPQVVEMGEASHMIELPSSEIADPMRGLLHRATLLKDAR